MKTIAELQSEHSEVATFRAKALANVQHWSEQLRAAEQKEAELIGKIQELKQQEQEQGETPPTPD